MTDETKEPGNGGVEPQLDLEQEKRELEVMCEKHIAEINDTAQIFKIAPDFMSGKYDESFLSSIADEVEASRKRNTENNGLIFVFNKPNGEQIITPELPMFYLDENEVRENLDYPGPLNQFMYGIIPDTDVIFDEEEGKLLINYFGDTKREGEINRITQIRAGLQLCLIREASQQGIPRQLHF